MLWYSRKNDLGFSRLVIGLIHVYRRLIKKSWKRRCLFRESCSQYVERVAHDEGSWAALGALWGRVRACRPGYSFVVEAATLTWVMECRDGSRHKPETLAESTRQEGAAFVAVTATAVTHFQL